MPKTPRLEGMQGENCFILWSLRSTVPNPAYSEQIYVWTNPRKRNAMLWVNTCQLGLCPLFTCASVIALVLL